MKPRRSISRRVFLTFGSFTLLLSLLYSAVSIIVAYAVEDAVLERILDQEVHHLEQAFRENGELLAPRVDYIKTYTALAQAPGEIRKVLEDSPHRREIFTNSGTHYHVQYLDLDDETRPLLVAEVTPLLVVSNVSENILVILIITLLVGLLISVGLAYRITLRTTRPVQDLAAELKNIADKTEAPLLSHIDADQELHYLAQTMEQSLSQLKSAIQRETDFNRDVSHELRTPLTVIKNTLALGKQRSLTTEDFRELDDSVSKLDQIVITLLALARSESVSLESFRLRPVMEECILELHTLMEELGFSVDLQLDDAFIVSGNQQLLRLLISNLLTNAMQHASKAHLDVFLENNELHFENDFSEMPEKELTEAGVRATGSPGLGQGLYLVSRIVDALDWEYRINKTGRRYSFILIPAGSRQK